MSSSAKASTAAGQVKARAAAGVVATPAQQSKHTSSKVDAKVIYLQEPADGEVYTSPSSVSHANFKLPVHSLAMFGRMHVVMLEVLP